MYNSTKNIDQNLLFKIVYKTIYKQKKDKKLQNEIDAVSHLRCQILTFISFPVDAITPYFLLNLIDEMK